MPRFAWLSATMACWPFSPYHVDAGASHRAEMSIYAYFSPRFCHHSSRMRRPGALNLCTVGAFFFFFWCTSLGPSHPFATFRQGTRTLPRHSGFGSSPRNPFRIFTAKARFSVPDLWWRREYASSHAIAMSVWAHHMCLHPLAIARPPSRQHTFFTS